MASSLAPMSSTPKRLSTPLSDRRLFLGHVSQLLVLAISEGLGGSHGDGVAGVDSHWVEVFYRADDHDIVIQVAHDLELEFFPAQNRFLDQQLMDWRKLETPVDNLTKLLQIEGYSSPRSAQRVGRPNHRRQTDFLEQSLGFLATVRKARPGNLQIDLLQDPGIHSICSTISLG